LAEEAGDIEPKGVIIGERPLLQAFLISRRRGEDHLSPLLICEEVISRIY
jgi:hypothetical protein